MDFSREQIWDPRKRRVVIALQDDRRRFAAGAQGRNAAASRFINAAVETALAESKPVISVDTKKKELVGDRKNAGQEWRPQGASAHYADGGGSNGLRVRLWKRELQKLADEFGITIEVHHFVPGTNKWNRIEHLLFSFITQNWRQTLGQLSRDRRSDRRHNHKNRIEGLLRTNRQTHQAQSAKVVLANYS
jgi:hypothetical protein